MSAIYFISHFRELFLKVLFLRDEGEEEELIEWMESKDEDEDKELLLNFLGSF